MLKVSKKVLQDLKKDWCLCYLDREDKSKGAMVTTKANVKKYLKGDGEFKLGNIRFSGNHEGASRILGTFIYVDKDWGYKKYVILRTDLSGRAIMNNNMAKDEKVEDLIKNNFTRGNGCCLTNIELKKAMIEGGFTDFSFIDCMDGNDDGEIFKEFDRMNE